MKCEKGILFWVLLSFALVLGGCGSGSSGSPSSSEGKAEDVVGESHATETDYIRVSIGGVAKEFGVLTSGPALGATSISGGFEGAGGDEVLTIQVPGTDVGGFGLDSGVTVVYMGPGGTYLAKTEAIEHGAFFNVQIDEYEDFVKGRFSGTLVRVDPATGNLLTLELEDGEFSVTARRRR